MKTVKEISRITGISIRTLRYYDEIGILKPAKVSEAGYRLYDTGDLEKLQEILFYKELEIPLVKIKEIMENPTYNRQQALAIQKSLLVRKRNRLNGIIELIDDVMKGVNTMSFEAFNETEATLIFEHSLKVQDEASMNAIIEKFGSIEAYRDFFVRYMKDENTSARLIRYYGSKDKALEASLQSTGEMDVVQEFQAEIDTIYKQFAALKVADNAATADELVMKLAESYKKMFKLDNARNMLLDVARGYVELEQLSEATDAQYGVGVAKYIGETIRHYYGE